MTALRRYTPMKPSRGTVIPLALRLDVRLADALACGRRPGYAYGCPGRMVGMPGECFGAQELDHVRASGGLGMKSPTERGNLVSLCSTHHRLKTLNGREWRPKLLAYIAQRDEDGGR